MTQHLPLQKGRAVQWRQPEPDKLPSISPGRVGSQRGGRGEQQRERGPAEMTPRSERKYDHYVRLTQHGSSVSLIWCYRSKKMYIFNFARVGLLTLNKTAKTTFSLKKGRAAKSPSVQGMFQPIPCRPFQLCWGAWPGDGGCYLMHNGMYLEDPNVCLCYSYLQWDYELIL